MIGVQETPPSWHAAYGDGMGFVVICVLVITYMVALFGHRFG